MDLHFQQPFGSQRTTVRQTGSSLEVDVTESGGDLTVDYRVETTAENDGLWEGVVEVFVTGQDAPAASEDVTGFVDAFDDPPFTDGEVVFDVDTITGGVGFEEVDVVVTWTSPDFISETESLTVGDGGIGGGEETLTVGVEQVADDLVVDWRVETFAENEGLWDGTVEVFTNGDPPAVERDITGFVDGFDDPPFTEGDITIPISDLGVESSQNVDVVVTWFNQSFISETVSYPVSVDSDPPDNGDDPPDPGIDPDLVSLSCDGVPSTVEVGEPTTIDWTVVNNNDGTAAVEVDVLINGSMVDGATETVTVGANSTASGSTTIEFDEDGDYQVSLSGVVA